MPVFSSSRFLTRAAGLAGVLIAASTQIVAAADNATAAPTPAQCEAVNNRSLYAFMGVALTPRQEAAYRAINADVATRLVPIAQAGVPTPVANGLSISAKVVGPGSDAKIATLNARMATMVRNGMNEDAQITALTQEFGPDFIIERAKTLVYTAQQVSQSVALVNEFTGRMAANLTTSQRGKFLRNSADLRTHSLCNTPGQTFNMPLYVGRMRG